MAQRVAVLGILNKRNGIVQNVTLRPGQSVRWKDAIVRLRACETTAPWEEEKLTGAFVQLDVQKPDKSWNRVFSGWVYKESPSLNVVEHAVYDVWPKSCAMTYPAAPSSPAAPASSSNLSSARKSGPAPVGAAKPSTSTAGSSSRAGPRHRSAERGGEQRDISFARDADRAERGEMVGHELAVEQGEIPDLQPRHEPGQRDLRGIGRAAEHAFAEERAAELDPVEAADKIVRLPDFDRMGVVQLVERAHRALELGVDPGFLAVRAGRDHVREVAVVGDPEPTQAKGPPKRAREMEIRERDDRPVARLDPVKLVRFATVGHREDAAGISLQEKTRVEATHDHIIRHSRESGNPVLACCAGSPAFAGRRARESPAPCPAGGRGGRR